LLAALLLAYWQGLKGLGGWGLAIQPSFFKKLFTGLVTGIFFFCSSIAIGLFIGTGRFTAIPSIEAIIKDLPMILLITGFPSVAEDILTRGYLYAHGKERMNAVVWIFLSALVYVLNHIWRLNEDPAVLIYLFILGLGLALAVWRTGNLWMAFGIHWGANLSFQYSSSIFKIEDHGNSYENTWLLALSYLLMLGCLLVFLKSKKQAVASNDQQ
jgi:membrane protease YdiL (CAAX protease family)